MTSARDEGYVKFRSDWKQVSVSGFEEEIASLIEARQRLYKAGLIGVYPDGIGYGNVSARSHDNRFVISGTRTGALAQLKAEDFAQIISFDLDGNWVKSKGLREPSSEAMTHAVVYQLDPSVHFVLHIHTMKDWKRLLYKVPTTRKSVPYGTPEMAAEVRRLAFESPLLEERIFCMAGHEEGIVSFGESIEAAITPLLSNGIGL